MQFQMNREIAFVANQHRVIDEGPTLLVRTASSFERLVEVEFRSGESQHLL